MHSKIDLDRGKDDERKRAYDMFWHLQEFDPIDLDEEMDIDEKFEKKKVHEKICEKFRKLGDRIHIKKF